MSELLDIRDPIPGSYVLEVSRRVWSAPCARKKIFSGFSGKRPGLYTIEPVNGRKKFTGTLVQASQVMWLCSSRTVNG